MSSNFDMATPISNLQNNQVNVNNLVSSVESNIDNVIPANNMLPTTTYQPTMVQQPVVQQPVVQQPMVQQQVYQQPVQIVNNEEEIKKKPWYNKILSESKEYIIIFLLFLILAHPKIQKMLVNSVPILNKHFPPYPSLILRGLFLVLVLFSTRKFF